MEAEPSCNKYRKLHRQSVCELCERMFVLGSGTLECSLLVGVMTTLNDDKI